MNSIKTLLLNLLILHSFLYSNAQNNLEMVDSSIVKLNKFEIEQIGKNIKVYWSSLYEKNNDYFILERSLEGNNWNELEVIPGSNCSTTEIFYDVIDYSPLEGNNYYRLWCVNKSGEEVKLIENKIIYYNQLYNLATPSKNVLEIKGQSLDFNSLKIYNMFGNFTIDDLEFLSIGNEKININISQFAMGIYIVCINGETLRFMKF